MTGDLFFLPTEDERRPSLDFESQLNPTQLEAVTAVDGPVLVVAGAGSGKTRTLVYRVAYLVEQGVPPEAILLLTFTRKSAAEMLERAEALVGAACAKVAGGTFHSLAYELLRQWAGVLGYPTAFGVLDRADMEEILGQLRRSAQIGEKDPRFPKRATLATIISKAANKSVALKDLIVDEYIHLAEYLEPILVLARAYEAYKKENAVFDFDDLLIQLNRLLQENEEVRRTIAAKYRYIMVDEYQDTNLVQAEIVYQLAKDHRNVMVVGDDAQSIYSFRGASFKNIMDFPKLFPQSRIVRLEENYRSTQPILDLTNHIISKAREKYEKRLFTRRPGREKPHLLITATQMEQSEFICRKAKEYLAGGLEPSQIAVLFRASRHSFKLEVELARHGLDYIKYGGRRFLEAAHVKDLLSFLRVTANPQDGMSLVRVLSMLEGIGPKAASSIVAWIGGRREKLINLKDYPGKGKAKGGLGPLAELFGKISGRQKSLTEKVDHCWEFYRPIMEAKFDDHPSRVADIKEFLLLAQNYTSLSRFLADMALEPPNASGLPPAGRPRGKLILSTVHSAKGLEWQVVFIIWVTEGRFPPFYSLDNPDVLDEERRLFYVAATRAADHLYLICPLEYDFEGNQVSRPRPSRFIADVPSNLLSSHDEPNLETRRSEVPFEAVRFPREQKYTISAPLSGPATDFAPDQKVVHPIFGLGRVIRMIDDKKIRVDFDSFGLKTLVVSYAGLKPVD